ncbi:MAG: hypothetical protein LBH98_06465 [Chitinispirillales bacterium]|jgi:hypothetical protein|nr:hypothetical protein [Chitinispirillales bacterium]
MIKLFLMFVAMLLVACGDGTGRTNQTVNSCIEGVEIPKGALVQRGGIKVNGNNVKEFLTVFESAFNSDEEELTVQKSEQEGWEVFIRYGLYGYIKERQKTLEETNLNVKELFDYSENGRLYIGGGEIEIYNDDTDESCNVARFQFTGEFSGEVVYENLKLSFESKENGYVIKRTSGKVTVNGIDITDLTFPERTVICYYGNGENNECLPMGVLRWKLTTECFK